MNVNAIQSLTGPAMSAPEPRATQGPSGASSFGAMLISLGEQALSNIKASESASIAGLQGQAPVQEVIMKTLAAEQSLQAAVAVRDKLVSALNDLTHMQI